MPVHSWLCSFLVPRYVGSRCREPGATRTMRGAVRTQSSWTKPFGNAQDWRTSARFSLVYPSELRSQLPIWQRSAWVIHLGQVAQVEASQKYNGELGLR